MKTDNKDFWEDDQFKVGQIWKYNTRQGEENSTLMLLKVEQYEHAGVIVHICITGLNLKYSGSSGFTDEIAHLPVSKEMIMNSVTSLLSTDNHLPDFEDGFLLWKAAFAKDKAGVFSIPVKDIVNYVDVVLNDDINE